MRKVLMHIAAVGVQHIENVVGIGWGGHHSNLRQTCR